jgi:hypothetical protein
VDGLLGSSLLLVVGRALAPAGEKRRPLLWAVSSSTAAAGFPLLILPETAAIRLERRDFT